MMQENVNKFSEIKSRVIQFLENKGVNKEKFFQKIGVTSANFRGNAQKTPLNSNAIENIFTEFPEINLEWLLTGRGEMLRDKQEASHQPTKQGIPLIPLDAMAGFAIGSEQVVAYSTDRYIVPEFDELKVDFLIRVKGSSMYPKYNSGDIVACKKLALSDIFFQWNKVYVLDTEQGALIKRIRKGSDAEHITLVSDNEKYEPFELEIGQLHAVALVVGVIRLE
jgi:repressor LexA